jgi:hypothetical protein
LYASVSSTGLVTASAPGAARIRASSGTAEGVFTVSIAYADCATVTPTATIVVGQSHSGDLSSADCILFGAGSRTDGWTITIGATTTLRFTASSGSSWLSLLLTDVNFNFVNSAYSFAAGEPARMIAALAPGTYRLWVYGDDAAAGAYTLSTSPATICAAAGVAGPLTVGDSEGGALSAASCLLPHGIEGQGWAFSTAEAGFVRFSVTTDGFSPWLVITDQSLEVLGVGAPTGSSTAVFDNGLPAGDHLVWVTTTLGGFGAFTIAREVSAVVLCGPPSDTVDVGQTVAGSISVDDCRTVRGTPGDAWALTLASTTPVDVNMTSGSFDTFLLLLDSAGTVVDFDDDGGDGLNSRLVATLAPGRYTLQATSYDVGETGGYSLSVALFPGVVAGLQLDEPRRTKRPRADQRRGPEFWSSGSGGAVRGDLRSFVRCSNANPYARSCASLNGLPRNSRPAGSESGVNPAGTVSAGNPMLGLSPRLSPRP